MPTRKKTTMQTPTNTAPPPTTPRQRNSWGHFIPRSGSVTSQPAASATAGPRSLEAAPPVLSLFRHGAIAVLRIHDLAFSGVVSAVVQSLRRCGVADAGDTDRHEDVCGER